MAETGKRRTEWKSSYKLGVRGIDDDHFILIGLVNELEEAVYTGQGRPTVNQTLGSLAAYVKVHFTREERLMRSHSYPDSESHKSTHDSFARRVLEFQDSHGQGHPGVSEDMLEYLRSWIVNHIMSHDREAATHLLSQGVA